METVKCEILGSVVKVSPAGSYEVLALAIDNTSTKELGKIAKFSTACECIKFNVLPVMNFFECPYHL